MFALILNFTKNPFNDLLSWLPIAETPRHQNSPLFSVTIENTHVRLLSLTAISRGGVLLDPSLRTLVCNCRRLRRHKKKKWMLAGGCNSRVESALAMATMGMVEVWWSRDVRQVSRICLHNLVLEGVLRSY